MLIVTSKQMQEIEEKALHYDITMPRLMENAGSAASAFIRKTFPVENVNCMVFCGRGNNGGDGFVVARKLKEYGANVITVLVQGEPRTAQAKQMLDFLKVQEIPLLSLESQQELVETYSKHANLIVDAVYGTGFHGSLSGASMIACRIMNDAPAAVVSLDAPSGVCCDRGTVSYGSTKADFTVAFQLLKPLHILPHSLEYCGHVQVVDIGIPEEVYQDIISHFSPITAWDVSEWLPKRLPESHKGDYGHLLLICGSTRYQGAAVLSTLSALRSGVGLCTIASTESVCNHITSAAPEAIVCPLLYNQWGELDFRASQPLLEKQLNLASAVLFGCGCEPNSAHLELLKFLIQNSLSPLILDAGALTLLADHPQILRHARQPVVITPHPGEMASLANTSTVQIQANRLLYAMEYAEKHNIITVLKGYKTIIALPEGKLYLNETGNSGLAKGGSGDLLAGLIAGLIAQKIPPDQACAAGVWLHGTAADRCADRLSMRGMLPSDILTDLCDIFLELED